MRENLEMCRPLEEGQEIINLSRPIKETGHLQILYGNIAPGGCVGKITGKEGLSFTGPARVFDSEEDMLSSLTENLESLRVSILRTFSRTISPLSDNFLTQPQCNWLARFLSEIRMLRLNQSLI